jgi:hypothetical protein
MQECQFIRVLNMNRFAPFRNNVNVEISESSEELALTQYLKSTPTG